MKLIKYIFYFLTFTLFTVNVSAQPAEENDATSRLLQRSLASLMQKNKIRGGAIEMYVNGKLYEQYYGQADDSGENPVIRKTIFEIGSISKIMTSLLFAQEYDWAKMALNDPVSKYVKDLPPNYEKINLQDLAIHSSEIDLLARAMEISTESTFADLYRRHVLNPLQMVNGVTVPAALTKYYAQGYDRAGNAVARVGEENAAANGIKASASDMQKFLSAAIGLPGTPPRVFYPMRLTQSMFVKMNDGYKGLAWQIHPIRNNSDIKGLSRVTDYLNRKQIQEILQRPNYSDNVMMDKAGTTKGFTSYIAVIPGKKSGIVILLNKNIPEYEVARIAREILFQVTRLS